MAVRNGVVVGGRIGASRRPGAGERMAALIRSALSWAAFTDAGGPLGVPLEYDLARIAARHEDSRQRLHGLG